MSRFNTGFGNETSYARIQTGVDTACGTQLHARFQSGITKTYHKITISPKPLHGHVGSNEMHYFAYMPDPGYIGDDIFDALIDFDENGKPGRTVLHVQVTVAP